MPGRSKAPTARARRASSRLGWPMSLVSAVVVAIAMVAAPMAARAEDDDESKRAARRYLDIGDEHLTRGDKLMDRGKPGQALEAYEAGLESYLAAYDVYSDSKIYFPIARAEQKLGRFVDALGHYQLVLENEDELSRDVIKLVRAGMASVKKQLAALKLEVEQAGADVLVDGTIVGQTPLPGPHYMAPGKHRYVIKLEGHKPIEGEVDIGPGKVEKRKVDLERVPVMVEGSPPDLGVGGGDPDTGPSKTPLWIGVGATATFAAAATLTGMAAVSKHDTFDDESADPADRDAARDSGKKLALVTDVLWVATAAAAGYTVYQLIELSGDDDEGDGAQALRVSPYAAPEGAGVAVFGRF